MAKTDKTAQTLTAQTLAELVANIGRVVGYNLLPAQVDGTTATIEGDGVAYEGDYVVALGTGEVYEITEVDGTNYTVGTSLGVITEVGDALKEGRGIKITDGEITLDAHASEDTTYGAGANGTYGHVKTTSTYDTTSSDEACVLTQGGAYAMYNALKSQIETGVEGADYIPTSEKGQAGGVATLDDDGLVPTSQLPAYVSDIVEVDTFDDLPSEGEDDKIYITMDDNKTYRWGGTTYVEISASLALGETSETAFRGDLGKVAYDHSQETGNPHGTTLSDIAGSEAIGDEFTPVYYDGDKLVSTTNVAITEDVAGAITTAEQYTDGMISASESDLKAYADNAAQEAETSAVSTAQAYTDEQIADIDHDSAIQEYLATKVSFELNTAGELIMKLS